LTGTKFTWIYTRKGETDALTDKIKLIRGKVIDDALIKNTQLTVKKYFVEKGFLNTAVNIVQVNDSARANTATLRINVNKGSKVKINELAFNGNEEFSDRRLQKKMKKTKERRPFRIFTPSKFIPSEFENDKQKLIAYLNTQGYRDARIVSDTVYTHDDRSINIRLDIEEGRRYYFRNVTWEGNYVYTDEQLAAVLGIKPGDIYNVEEMEKKLRFNPSGGLDVTSLYMDDGYLFFNVEPVEIAVEGDSIDVEMRISEGAQATINKVYVTGNTRTSDHVIMRELRTRPGQKFSRTNLIRSQREIASLGYFDPEKVNPVPIPNPADGTVDIQYQVEERPRDQIELSGGWGGGGRNNPFAVGFVGTLGVVFNNFSTRKLFRWGEWGGILPSGDGQRLAIRFQASGRQFQTYSLSFTEPWLGGRRPNSFSFNLTHSVQNIIWSVTPQSFQISGATLSLGRRLRVPDDYFTLSNSLSYMIYNLRNYPLFNNPLTGQAINNGQFHNFTFNTTLARNSIDNPTFPRSGSSISLSASLTPPYSRIMPNIAVNASETSDVTRSQFIEYHKWMFDSNWFTPLGNKLVLSTRAHMGFIGRYGPTAYSPFERFVLGGSGMAGQMGGFILARDIIGLRGYPDNQVGPGQAGGVVYNKFVMEMRYPISLNPAATIFVLGFLEGGNNWGNFDDFNPFKIKRSAGIGARIFMPAFGLIGIDYGWGFDEIPNVHRAGKGQFHFTIGQQIR
jgi:outer membrane protein insertion porin family